MSARTARSCALALARFDDADLELEGGTLPSQVALLELLGLQEPTAGELAERWRAAGEDDHLQAMFALDQDGPFAIDLARTAPTG